MVCRIIVALIIVVIAFHFPQPTDFASARSPAAMPNPFVSATSASPFAGANQQSSDVEQVDKLVEQADQLFEEKKWGEARSAYQQAFQAKATPRLHINERLIRCAIMLREWEDAFRRAVDFKTDVIPAGFSTWYWDTDRDGLANRLRYLSHLELTRELLQTILRDCKPDRPLEFQNKVAAELIAVDFDLLITLDPDSVPPDEKRGWETGYSDMGWWWETVDLTEVDSVDDERPYPYQFWRIGVPVDGDGNPKFLAKPSEYDRELARAQKVLALLDEIPKLDASEGRMETARALFHRADLMRRLYGPCSDPQWRQAIFYYQYAELPSFGKSDTDSDLKELWELGDDESRALAGGKVRVFTLPPSESPIAIWRQIEASFPNSKVAARVIYQRGLYYQNRRQYANARREYEDVILRFPDEAVAKTARLQIKNIEHSDVLLGATGVYPLGVSPKLWFACRNAATIEFSARKFNLKEFLNDRRKKGIWWEFSEFGRNMFGYGEQNDKKVAAHLGEEACRWSQAINRSDQVETHSTSVPVLENGAYIVEARVPGAKKASKSLIVVTDAAVVKKELPDKVLLWAVDARTGRPLPGKDLQIAAEEAPVHPLEKSTTDQDGVVCIDDVEKSRRLFVWLETETGGIAFCNVDEYEYRLYEDDDQEPELKCFGITDRPLYRPGSRVNFRIWRRELSNQNFLPAKAGELVRVKINDSDYDDTIAVLDLTADETGSVCGSFQLDPEVRLGTYYIEVDDLDRYSPEVCQFRVEEYKKPEYEVAVLPGQTAPRLGEPIKFVIKATYYTGEPVVGAAVRYRVTRRDHVTRFDRPNQWDWLYGRGFDDYSYLYPWLGDSLPPPRDNEPGRDWWRESLEPLGEPVKTGSAELDGQGTVEISIETAGMPTDVDYEFTVTADVRDESRRTVNGTGSALATRQQFYAFAKLDRGWYQTGDQATVEINTRTANDVAVSSEGRLSLYRILGADNPNEHAEFQKEIVAEWPLKTDVEGRAQHTFKIPREGQYRIVFETAESVETPILAQSTVWSLGPDFDSRKFRFGALEVTPDKGTYQVGDTAKLLINSSQSNARVLMVDSNGRHWFIDVPNNSRIVEIPIEHDHVPSHSIQASLVSNGQVYSEACELIVPPVEDLLTMELHPGQPSYKPGQSGAVQIKVTNSDGDPVVGSMALRAYDKSLTYIASDNVADAKSLLAARRNGNGFGAPSSSLEPQQFGASGEFLCPEFHLDDASKPPAGGMGGAAPSGGDPADGNVSHTIYSRRTNGVDSSNANSLSEDLVEPEIRRDFSDTAVWVPDVELDAQGSAAQEIKFPDSITTWQFHGCLITPETKVGEAICEVKTKKDLLVRLQSPRFFVERDQVVLSANVHNYLPNEKLVAAELIIPAALFAPLPGAPSEASTPDAEGNLHLFQSTSVRPGDAQRFDWRFNVKTDGIATITVKAKTDVESDAMQLAFPVNPRGVTESSSQSGFFLPGETGSRELDLVIPTGVDPTKTSVEINLAPSAAGAVFDALPFLAAYPYGCVEQTMSRFYPTVLAADTLKKLGTDLQAIAQRATSKDARTGLARTHSPVVDSEELKRMSTAGLGRLYRFQHEDGGWGWWENDKSSPYMTAYVLLGLDAAADCGEPVSEDVYQDGVRFLVWKTDDLARPGVRNLGESTERALIAYVLSLKRSEAENDQAKEIDKWISSVYSTRENLNAYGRALLAMTLHNQNKDDLAKEVLSAIVATLGHDAKRDLSWVPTSEQQWWRWDNSDIETNAWVLRALVALDPNSEDCSRIANWLASQRQGGNHWRSTRDTALAVHALAEYLLAMRQQSNAYTVDVHLDGELIKEVPVGLQEMLQMESRVLLSSEQIGPGKHVVKFVKRDPGPLQFSIIAKYLDKPAQILPKGSDALQIERRYFRVATGSENTEVEPAAADRFVGHRVPLKFGDHLSVGETIEVELRISTDDEYEYLAFEDPKPAGCEPIRLRSGYGWGDGLCSNVELRDTKIVFFVQRLRKGQHVLRYKYRAEVPGTFSALPARGFAMYTPEIEARSDEMLLHIDDPTPIPR